MRHLDKSWLRDIIRQSTEFDHKTGCLNWTGAKDKRGYGTRRIGNKRNSKNYFAHRLSYYAVYGEFDEALNINHKCDNPSCVNPMHLYVGTQQDNMRDVKERKRRVGTQSPKIQGEKHPMARLSSEDVELIRFVKQQGGSLWKLHKEKYSHLSYSTIKAAGNDQNWRYV